MDKRTSVLCILLLLSVIEKWREPAQEEEGGRKIKERLREKMKEGEVEEGRKRGREGGREGD